MLKFPSIEQYRNVVRDVLYYTKANPATVRFTGTVKLHGTNACVGRNLLTGATWCQSRNNIITVEKDNAGFAAFATKQAELFDRIFRDVRTLTGSSQRANDIRVYIYGEWCGSGIQKGVALSELDRMFVIFNIVWTTGETNEHGDTIKTWLEPEAISRFLAAAKGKSGKEPVYYIHDFPTFSMDIDFKTPKLFQNELCSITEEVEKECPVGKHFGVSGTGEGVVWTGSLQTDAGLKHFRFKVKGEKHSVTKVKKLANVDHEKLKSINEFLDYAVTENRLKQGYGEFLDPCGRDTGKFISWMVKDVLKEESDTLKANGLEEKDVKKGIAERSRRWFLAQL